MTKHRLRDQDQNTINSARVMLCWLGIWDIRDQNTKLWTLQSTRSYRDLAAWQYAGWQIHSRIKQSYPESLVSMISRSYSTIISLFCSRMWWLGHCISDPKRFLDWYCRCTGEVPTPVQELPVLGLHGEQISFAHFGLPGFDIHKIRKRSPFWVSYKVIFKCVIYCQINYHLSDRKI